ncbi:MAG: hypothetical protein ACPGSL_03925 [Vicingaceae bacterium]
MKNKTLFFAVSFLLLTPLIKAQENKNVQDYTPSVLISKGQSEFKLFNSLYTQSQFFDTEGTKLDEGSRSSFFTTIAEYNYGVSNRVSLGGEMWFKSSYKGGTNTSPANVLRFSNSKNSRSGIALAGFKIKFNPIKKWKRFSFQSGLMLSVISDPESKNLDRPFLDNNRHLWITKFLYDKKLSNKFQLFAQLSSWVSIDKELAKDKSNLATPLDIFISYFPNKKITIYLQNQFWPSIGSEGVSSYYLQEGLGLKYQLFSGVELETSYTKFIIGKDTGAGETFNLGVRILH